MTPSPGPDDHERATAWLDDRELAQIADRLARAGDRATALAGRLAGLGLNPRAVAGCFGVRCVGHATRPAAADRVAPVPAALLPLLFVAGSEVASQALRRRLGDDLDLLGDLGLIAMTGERVRPTLGLLPIGAGLVACEHPAVVNAAPQMAGGGSSPDDSTFHLLGALPVRRVASWLDVGTGNGAAVLARLGLARTVVATDIDPRALRFATVGQSLSGAAEVRFDRADLLAGAAAGAPWSLISFNAPIPARGDDILDRFWSEVPRLVASDGEVIVHSQQAREDHAERLALPGQTVAVRYTPPEHRPAFGITLWRPGGPAERHTEAITLTASAPHVCRDQLGID